MINDWMYQKRMVEYERRLHNAEIERRAKRVAIRRPRRNVLRSVMASVGRRMVALGERLEHESRTPAHASARR